MPWWREGWGKECEMVCFVFFCPPSASVFFRHLLLALSYRFFRCLPIIAISPKSQRVNHVLLKVDVRWITS